MTEIISTFNSTKQPLSAVLGAARDGTTQLPDFQRGWVWDDDRIRDLLASVSRGFPIGTVMMLETGGDGVQFKPRPIEGVTHNGASPDELILDGQQRITSLFQALASGKPVRTRDQRGKEMNRWYYVDMQRALDPNEEREDAIISVPENKRVMKDFGREVHFDLSTPELEFENLHFPLAQVFDSADWHEGFVDHWDSAKEKWDLWKRFRKEFLVPFEQFQLPVIQLKKETPKEAVCLVFEKVNTGGVSLTVFELLTATFAASGFDLREDWNTRKAVLDNRRILSDVSSTDFLQAVTLLTSHAERVKRIEAGDSAPPQVTCKRRDMLKLSAEDYQAWREDVTAAFDWAARFLHSQHIYDPKFLPYGSQLVPIAALRVLLGHRTDDHDVRRKFEQWYWCGVFGELYGSTTETRFARDVVDLVAWANGGPVPRTVADANFAPERLLTMRTRNSAAYRGLYALLLREGARDFRTGEISTLHTYFDENVDIHHLFPKKWCRERKVEASVYDSIVNKTPLTSRTNRIVGGNAPSQYLSSLERNHGVGADHLDEHLRSHWIDPESIRQDRWKEFFQHRSEAMLDAIGEAMGKQPQDVSEDGWLPDLSYDEVEPEPNGAEEGVT